ncbi:hypothetical protein [Nocardia sp. NPDC052566]|uniref:hypothetical protein n=1 Tax=Nocardia sp. NPDC052566 TaxID=3364330 RepID=UPI0037C74C5B
MREDHRADTTEPARPWTPPDSRTTLECVEPQQLRTLIEKLTTESGDLADVAQLEIALCWPGTDAAVVCEKLLPDLEAVSQDTGDLTVFQAITALPDRSVPYRLEEIAGLVGADASTVRRVLAWMITQQLAERETK